MPLLVVVGLFVVASAGTVLLFCFEFALICACGLPLGVVIGFAPVGLVMVCC